MKVLLWLSLICLTVFLVGCGGSKDPEVKFTLSNWFNGGLVDIRLNEEEGIEIPLVEGVYEVSVPVSGVVLVKSFGPLLGPHSETVLYEGGSPVPLPIRKYDELTKDLKYWWPVGRSSLRDGDDTVVTRLIYRIATPDEPTSDDVFAAADAQIRQG